MSPPSSWDPAAFRVSFALTGCRIFVAGHTGMVGSALVRRLARESCEILTVPRSALDLRDPAAVLGWMSRERPDVVIIAAATVGGILANAARPADFIHDNLMIAANLIHASHARAVRKLLFLGSSCIYPRLAPQPMTEDALLSGPLEPTNEAYAVAKIAGIKLCEAHRRQHGRDFITVIPTNLYGPNDSFHPTDSHVLPGLMRRIHEAQRIGAKEVSIWGSGTPRREFLYVDDLADACVHLLKGYSGPSPINIGTGTDVTIRALADMLAEAVGWSGGFRFDPAKPDGAPRKLLDVSRLCGLGWRPTVGLHEGIARTYRWFLDHPVEADRRMP